MPAQLSDVWFITGCSSGFGRDLAKLVLDRGYRAVITARDPRTIQDLTTGREGRALALKLDVTNKAEVAESVNVAQTTFGSIDVLVNNAGYGYVGAIEESEEDEVRAMVDTNFFGLARMIRAVLPAMRKRRSGCIVNISSNGGLQAFPGFGYYNATKFAVEGLSEALEKEVAPLGIKVMLVEPGPFRTDWAGRSLKRTNERIPEYAETAGVPLERLMSGSGKQVGDPVRAGEAIIKAVESENMPLHLVLGKIAVETARSKIELLRRDVDAWEEVALSADYPEHQTTSVK
jgi:NADP-dependent 3-hydroxy acid dehydrogenase YdfG